MNDSQNVPFRNEAFDDRLWASFNWRHALLLLTFMTVVLFGDVLFFNDGKVLSAKGLDLYSAEIPGLDFLFGELKKGHLALWNPHVFSGTSIMSTPIYPPHVLFLFFSLPQAINVSIVLHILMIGFFMYLWTASRKLHPLACLLSGVMLMFSGPFFMHVYAGHLGNLCAMTWVPLIFRTIDGMMDRPSIKWSLLAILAVTMQVLTSQYQYVYYTALAVAIYASLRVMNSTNRNFVLLGLISIPCGSLLLSAFHLFPDLLTVQEGVRSTGVSLNFAAMFSFPPENLITFLSPFFFGDMQSSPYWGRCYLWEMSLFFSITGFILMVYGVIHGEKDKRCHSFTMALVLIILALGVHTPLFTVLYDWLPGFDKFRGTSKFSFQASMFLIMLAGFGLDHLIRRGHLLNRTLLIPFLAAIMLGSAALFILYTSSSDVVLNVWRQFLNFISATGESYLPLKAYQDVQFIRHMAVYSVNSLLISACLCLLLTVLFYLLRYSKRTVYVIFLVALSEVFIFAMINRPTFDYNDTPVSNFKKFYESHPGDYRVLNFTNPNTAMSTGSRDVWGYGPVAMGRYVQFMAFTQGADPDKANTYLRIHQYHRLFSMLRLRYILIPENNNIVIHEFNNYMPRISIIHHWKVAETREEIFEELGKQTFNPRETVILEKQPVAFPAHSDQEGTCTFQDESSDDIIIKANLSSPAILLITENYSRGWRIVPLKLNIQERYDILPANYTLMAIPLEAGDHILKLEYMPQAFIIGKWISLVFFIIYVFSCFGLIAKKFYRKNLSLTTAKGADTDSSNCTS